MSRETDNEAFVREFQRRAGIGVDGWAGRKEAWPALDRILPLKADTGVHVLSDPDAFYASVRASFGPLKDVSQVAGFNFLLSAMKAWPIEWAAYGLATAWHETGTKMHPIRELGGHAYLDKYDTGKLAAALGNTPEDDDDGQLYAGRGYVQITGRANYRKFGIEATPDDALKPDVAARIMVEGMEAGAFTGKGLKSYPLGHYTDYRRIINGTDKAAQIAGYALKFENALRAGGW